VPLIPKKVPPPGCLSSDPHCFGSSSFNPTLEVVSFPTESLVFIFYWCIWYLRAESTCAICHFPASSPGTEHSLSPFPTVRDQPRPPTHPYHPDNLPAFSSELAPEDSRLSWAPTFLRRTGTLSPFFDHLGSIRKTPSLPRRNRSAFPCDAIAALSSSVLRAQAFYNTLAPSWRFLLLASFPSQIHEQPPLSPDRRAQKPAQTLPNHLLTLRFTKLLAASVSPHRQPLCYEHRPPPSVKAVIPLKGAKSTLDTPFLWRVTSLPSPPLPPRCVASSPKKITRDFPTLHGPSLSSHPPSSSRSPFHPPIVLSGAF